MIWKYHTAIQNTLLYFYQSKAKETKKL